MDYLLNKKHESPKIEVFVDITEENDDAQNDTCEQSQHLKRENTEKSSEAVPSKILKPKE